MAKLFTKMKCPLECALGAHILGPTYLGFTKRKTASRKGQKFQISLKVTPILVTSYDVKNILTVCYM